MKTENSGSYCDYYQIPVENPQHPAQTEAYVANTEDLIQALQMTFDEGCELKSLVRRANARLGFIKAETTAVRDAAKGLHYAQRIYDHERRKAGLVVSASGREHTIEQETQVAAYACSACLDTKTVDAGNLGSTECPYCKPAVDKKNTGCTVCFGAGVIRVSKSLERPCPACKS